MLFYICECVRACVRAFRVDLGLHIFRSPALAGEPLFVIGSVRELSTILILY